jgi:excisionase family DNA binding protein
MEPRMENTTVPHRLLSVDEAAAYAGVNPRTIRRRIAEGDLVAHRIGRKLIRIELVEIHKMLRPIQAAGGDHEPAA